MAETKVYGLKSIKIGVVLPNGDMQTAISEQKANPNIGTEKLKTRIEEKKAEGKN